MLIEKMIIRHCSPTLASIKTANLFSVTFDDINQLRLDISSFENSVTNSGVLLKLFNVKAKTALIYVYRKSLLERELENPEVKQFLSEFGYTNFELDYVLNTLEERIRLNDGFPHEIGIFLGYPLADVKAFIVNKGKHYSYCGYWKVYFNSAESLKKFALFDRCRDVYSKLWEKGRSIQQLTIVA